MGVFDTAAKKIINLLGMTTLGQKTKATALGVTLASDEDALGVTSTQLPSSLGQKAKTTSLGVTLAMDEDALSVDDNAGSLTVDSPQLPASLGQATKAGSLSMTLASDQGALPVTDNSASLTVDSPGIPTSIGQKTKAASMGVTLASDQESILVDSPGIPSSIGQKTKATAMGVTLASDEDALAVTIANGSDVTEGNTSDAAVITDTTGTLSGKLRGLVKWAFERMPDSLGQKLMTASLGVVVASDQTPIFIKNGNTNTLFVGEDIFKYKVAGTVLDVNTTPYSAGDQLGAKITISDLVRAAGASVRLRSVTVTDKSKQKAAFHILFFDASPTSTTIPNNSAFDVDPLDVDKIVAQAIIASADYKDCTTQSYACVQYDLPIVAESGVSHGYMICVCDGTPTYAEHALGITLEFARAAG